MPQPIVLPHPRSTAMATVLCAVMLILPASAGAETAELLFSPIGEMAGESFGFSVSTVGDVNGDGYADVIAGAIQNDAGGTNAGRAYLYFGGPGADTVADLTFTGENAYDGLGYLAGPAGDLNGDGFDDWFVTSLSYSSSAGRVYVYFGGPGIDAIADLVLNGELAGDVFGVGETAGDVNGDGYDDLIVAAPNSDAGGLNSGRAYLYYGGPSVDAVADLVFTGAAGDNLGTAVGTAGDVNGDGHADLIIGAAGYGVPFNDQIGRAYVFHGGPGIDTVADLTFTGEAKNNNFGDALGTAGDFNGDGYADVVVGATGNATGGSQAGRVYVFFGGPGADEIADVTISGVVDQRLGNDVGSAGDVNGDGFSDLIVSSDFASAVDDVVYVFHGGAVPDTLADLTLVGASLNDGFGRMVGTAGDVNGDGLDDIVIAAPYDDAAGVAAGRFYVYSTYLFHLLSPNGGETWVSGQPAVVRWEGRDLADIDLSVDGGLSWSRLATGAGGLVSNEHDLLAPAIGSDFAVLRITVAGEAPNASNSVTSAAPFRLVPPARPVAHTLQWAPTGGAVNDDFGWAVASAGDVNGDGLDDVIVGALQAGGLGEAYVFAGGSSDTDGPIMVLTGGSSDLFGTSVASAGDVNGDGYDDVLVGAEVQSEDGIGRVFLFHGGPGADSVADLVITGEVIEDVFGWSVGTAGDVNGDGFDDIVVGAYSNDAAGADAGRAYVYFGGPGMDAFADLTFSGEAAQDRFGWSVGTAGDVNGDGFADVIVSAYLNDAGGGNAGRAYVFYGGPAANATPNLILTGEAVGDRFGWSVGTAGDVNGDSFDDMIVGATYSDAGGSSAGRAYVFYGGLAPDPVPDLVLTGDTAGANFGNVVGSAGDVNADGFGDLVVSAFLHPVVGPNGGRVYVYHGGPAPDGVPDLVLTGEAAYDQYGYSAGGAGDTNGDGFDDLIVGAYFNDLGGLNAGRVYVYDCNRYQVVSPTGADLWNVGASETITWRGAEPADVWLSVDGGDSYSLLRSNRGGSPTNGLTLTVPHQPTRFAKVRITPHDALVTGSADSDSLFTIEASIALLNLKAQPVEGGVLLSWETDPGPEDLAGYRLERSNPGDHVWTMLTAQTRETEYLDPSGGAGMRYRLTGVNGLGEELLLGETSLTPRATLAAWPVPYRGGDLNLSFATYSGRGGGAGMAEVAIYDVRGRLVRTVTRGLFEAGVHTLSWDGRDAAGSAVSRGVYFLRVVTAGEVAHMKLVVTR